MADPPSSPERNAGPDGGSTAGTPRWVKVSGIIALAVLLLLIVLLVAGGNHGPGRHRSSGRLGDSVESVDAAAQDRR
jgi:hypothetical protein